MKRARSPRWVTILHTPEPLYNPGLLHPDVLERLFVAPHSNLAAVRFEYLGQHQSALDGFRHCVELAPDDARYRCNLSVALVNSGGDLTEAHEHASMAAKLRPSDPRARIIAADVAARLDQWPVAMEHALACLTHGDDSYFESNWSDVLDFFAAAAEAGRASEARGLLLTTTPRDRWSPLVHALAAASEGSVDSLRSLAPEMREAVELALRRIAPHLLPG